MGLGGALFTMVGSSVLIVKLSEQFVKQRSILRNGYIGLGSADLGGISCQKP